MSAGVAALETSVPEVIHEERTNTPAIHVGKYFTLPVELCRYSPVPRCRYCGILLEESNLYPSIRRSGRYVCIRCYRPRVNRSMRHYFLDTRRRLLALLGRSCRCNGADCWHNGPCNISDLRVLQVDHINGGGSQEPRKLGHARDVYLYYLKNPEEARRKLQPLRANCNWTKIYRNKERSDKYGLSKIPVP